MKIIILCALALAAFSCSSNQKVTETKVLDRTVASPELDVILRVFQEKAVIFNAEALKIKQSHEKRLNSLKAIRRSKLVWPIIAFIVL